MRSDDATRPDAGGATDPHQHRADESPSRGPQPRGSAEIERLLADLDPRTEPTATELADEIDTDLIEPSSPLRVPDRPYLHLPFLLAVFAGGTLGSALRIAVAHLVPAVSGWPLATVVVNLVGAPALGFVTELVARSAFAERHRLALRAGLGTGVIGGFTTYSTLSTDTAQLIMSSSWPQAIGYAVGSVVLGVLGAIGGRLLADRVHRAVHPVQVTA